MVLHRTPMTKNCDQPLLGNLSSPGSVRPRGSDLSRLFGFAQMPIPLKTARNPGLLSNLFILMVLHRTPMTKNCDQPLLGNLPSPGSVRPRGSDLSRLFGFAQLPIPLKTARNRDTFDMCLHWRQ